MSGDVDVCNQTYVSHVPSSQPLTNSPTCADTHHPTTAVVVQVHQRTGIFAHPLPGIHKGLGKLDAVIDVVAASTPVETSLVVTGLAALVAVTAADLELPLTAGPGDGIDHTGRGDRVHECCFSATWTRQVRRKITAIIQLSDTTVHCCFQSSCSRHWSDSIRWSERTRRTSRCHN